MIQLKKIEWYLLIGLALLSFVPSIGGIFRFIELVQGSHFDFLPENPRVTLSPVPAIFHLVGSVCYCILGAFQFLPSFREHYRHAHRISGYLLVCAGIVSALSGLWMTCFYSFSQDLQGNLLYVVRILVSLSMVVFICFGIASIHKKRMHQHRAWMIRAYALAQGAGTQVFIALPWLLTIGEPTGLIRDSLMMTAWLMNLVIAEWFIRNKRFITQLTKTSG